MKQFNHISLVHKHLNGGLSTVEKEAYNTWLSQPGNMELAEDLGHVWKVSAEYVPTSFQPNADLAFNKFKKQIASEKIPVITTNEVFVEKPQIEQPKAARVVQMNPMRWVARVAASLVFIAAAFFLLKDMGTGTAYDTEIFASALQSTDLNDGTEIWLEEGARLAVAEDYDVSDRKLQLTGKAFFDVERNEEKPFIVEMGNNKLEVLGTSFNIDNSGEDVLVEVKTGLVKVYTKTQTAELKAGQSATMNYELDEIVVGDVSSESFDWYQNKLVIKDLTIDEAMNKIADYYNVNIELSANVDKGCKLTSPLATNSSLSELLEVLQLTYSMKYEKIQSDSYLIKLLDCK